MVCTPTCFQEKIEECDDLLNARCGISKGAICALFNGALTADQVNARIMHTADAQLMIAVCEIALAAWLAECGLTPDCVFGHSLGEYVAAHVAGALSLDDTLYLIHQRGQAMDAAPDGGMLAVRASAQTVHALIAQYAPEVELAAVNSPEDVTVTGALLALEKFSAACRDNSILAIPLSVAKAFHSSLMTEAAAQLAQNAMTIVSHPPRVPLLGNADGARVTVCDANHWAQHMRAPVQFKACADEALAEGYTVMIELGGKVLKPFLDKIAQDQGVSVAMAAGGEEWHTAQIVFAALHTLGFTLKWSAIYGAEQSMPDLLPAYPFALQSYWLDQEPGWVAPVPTAAKAAVSGARQDIGASGNTEDRLKMILGKILKLAPDSLDTSRSFLDLGADSLVLIEMSRAIEEQFGVKITVQQLFGEQNTLKALSVLIDQAEKKSAPATTVISPAPVAPVATAGQTRIHIPPSIPAAKIEPSTIPHHHAHQAHHAWPTLFYQQLDTFKSLIDSQISYLQHIGSMDSPSQPIVDTEQESRPRPHQPVSPSHSAPSSKTALNDYAVAAFTYALASLCEYNALALPASVDALANKVGVVSERLRLWQRLCTHLASAGVLKITNNMIESAYLPSRNTAFVALETALERYTATLPIGLPATNCATLFMRCARELSRVLIGDKTGTEVLFSGNGMEEVAAIYACAPGTDGVHAALESAFKQTLQTLNSLNNPTPLHILEVGAGTGTTTQKILPYLASSSDNNSSPTYLFTDISPAFIHRARQTLVDWPCMAFATFDLERDPDQQAFPQRQFDFIIAANVIHTTDDLQTSLDRLHRMLTPNGVLLLVECIAQQPWLDLVFGLTDGWWRYNDTTLRQHGPLLDEKTWRSVLTKQAWQDVTITTFGETQALIYARR
ncbi:SAM-dependent methyltransferase [Glaciimonas sp. GG7]